MLHSSAGSGGERGDAAAVVLRASCLLRVAAGDKSESINPAVFNQHVTNAVVYGTVAMCNNYSRNLILLDMVRHGLQKPFHARCWHIQTSSSTSSAPLPE